MKNRKQRLRFREKLSTSYFLGFPSKWTKKAILRNRAGIRIRKASSPMVRVNFRSNMATVRSSTGENPAKIAAFYPKCLRMRKNLHWMPIGVSSYEGWALLEWEMVVAKTPRGMCEAIEEWYGSDFFRSRPMTIKAWSLCEIDGESKQSGFSKNMFLPWGLRSWIWKSKRTSERTGMKQKLPTLSSSYPCFLPVGKKSFRHSNPLLNPFSPFGIRITFSNDLTFDGIHSTFSPYRKLLHGRRK